MEQLAFTQFLNHVFGGVVLSALTALGIHPKHPAAPIPNAAAMEVLVFVLLTVFFLLVRMRLSVDAPGPLQHTMESIEGFIDNLGKEIIGGHHYHRYVPYLVTLGLFILACNLIGLVPGMESPTAVPVVPLGCALVTWFYYHIQGLRENGIGYIKHFMGPVWWLAPLMFPIEIFSHLARVLSLTIRLFANIMAEELVITIFFGLLPLIVPLPFMAFAIFGGLLQAFIFCTLMMVYLGGAVATEDH